MSTVAIAGSVVAAVVVILLCIGSAIIVVNLRRRKHQAEEKNRYTPKLPEHYSIFAHTNQKMGCQNLGMDFSPGEYSSKWLAHLQTTQCSYDRSSLFFLIKYTEQHCHPY